MLVLDAEERPHASTADLGKSDEEAQHGGVLQVLGIDGVEDPIEAQDRVEQHSEVVDPRSPVAERVAEEGVLRVWVQQTPIHGEVPNGAVDGVDGREEDEGGAELGPLVDAVET